MSEQPITTGAVEASYLVAEGDDAVDDAVRCGACGEHLKPGAQVVDVRVPEFGSGAVQIVHLRCYQGEELLT